MNGEMMTVEEVSKGFGDLGLFVTQSGVNRLLQLGYLKKSQLNYQDRRYTKYPFGIDTKSIYNYLVTKGYTEDEIMRIIS